MTATSGERGTSRGSSTNRGQGHIPSDSFPLRLVIARFDGGMPDGVPARLSIEKAAERCRLPNGESINAENWRRWEAGAFPRDKAEVAQAIANGLGIDREWLLYGHGGGPLSEDRGGLANRPSTSTVRYLPRAARPIRNRSNGRNRAGRSAQSSAA